MKKITKVLCMILIVLLSMNSFVYARFYTYDSLNRVTEVYYENGTKTNYSYDAGGNIISSNIVNLKTLTVDSTSLNMSVNDTHQITLTALYEDGQTTNVTSDGEFSSSDSSIVSVDEFGKIIAVKNGLGNIYVKYADKIIPIKLVVGTTIIDDIKYLQEKTEVDANKQWTIKFTNDFDASTITKENIKVVDSSGKNIDVNIRLDTDKKTILVDSPKGGYELGQTYYLNISKNVKDSGNNNLKRDIQMKFTIKK